MYKTFVGTMHCDVADLYVKERQKIQHNRARSTEERRRRKKKKKEEEKNDFFTSRGAYVNLCYIAMLYTHSMEISHRTRW